MTRTSERLAALALSLAFLSVAGAPRPAAAQASHGVRVSLFAQGATTTTTEGQRRSFSEVVTTVSVQPRASDTTLFDYALDLRVAGYPTSSASRSTRVSIYDMSITARMRQGSVAVRAGQMWLNDLGALGSVGGGLVEYRKPDQLGSMHLRAGAFAGAEPRILEAGYARGIRKLGGYVALDGNGARRHVAGYVNVGNRGVTERSVLVFTNFVPVGRNVFVYQAAEYDLTGPAGQGKGGLSYFFVNGRISPASRVEIQGTFHRGRSIDSRTITEDHLRGRPVEQRALDGLLFESSSGRVTVTVASGVRVFAGYGRDRNNRDEVVTGRTSFGVFASNLLGSGIDVNVTDSRIDRPGGASYDSWFVSVGRTLASRVYVTADYTTSLAVVRYTGAGGFTVLSRPHTRRYGLSGMVNLTRSASLLITGEHTDDDAFRENRVLSGLTYRF
ncbi:MAG: hypothetical protein ACE148_17710 [Vicinamibacterales bacterium]